MLTNGSIEDQADNSDGAKLLGVWCVPDDELGGAGCFSISLGLVYSSLVCCGERHVVS